MSNDKTVTFDEREILWLMEITKTFLPLPSTQDSPVQKAMIDSVRAKLSAAEPTADNNVTLSQEERSLIGVLTRNLFSVTIPYMTTIESGLLATVLGKIEH